jgi:hypothetical protein
MISNTTKSSPPLRLKRSISFSDTVTFRRIGVLSHEEIEAAWYSRAESKKILSKIRKTIYLMEKRSAKANSDRHCTRGLETLTPEGQGLKQHRRGHARNAVLDEQELQNEIGMPDPELIACLYREESSVSQTIARAVGLADEEEAVRITDIPREPSITRFSSVLRVLLHRQHPSIALF